VSRFSFSRSLVALALALAGCLAASPALASGEPSGEVKAGQSLIEPAYDYMTGGIVYLRTPINSPFPTHTNAHSVAPLYLVLYPPGSTVPQNFNLNCAHNCPDHDNGVASVGTGGMSGVYGTDVSAVPGHDHLVGVASTNGDFNVAWEVVVILFTKKTAANTHITKLSQLNAAIQSGNAVAVDLGFAFHCSVVSSAAYDRGTPL